MGAFRASLVWEVRIGVQGPTKSRHSGDFPRPFVSDTIVVRSNLKKRAHGEFTKIDHMPDHKTRLNEFQRINITWSVFSVHNQKSVTIK